MIYCTSYYNIESNLYKMQKYPDHDIIHLSFLSLSKSKIALSLIIIAFITYLLSHVSLFLTISVPLYIGLLAIHAINNNLKSVVKWLYWKHEWGAEEANYLAVYTSASRVGGRHSCPKLFVEKIRSRASVSRKKEVEGQEPIKLQERQNEIAKREVEEAIKAEDINQNCALVEVIFAFNHQVYRAVQNHIEKVTDIQKLKLLGIQDLLSHVETGLLPQIQKRSTSLFGQQTSFLTPSFVTFISFNAKHNSGWFFLSIFSVFATFCLTYSNHLADIGHNGMLIVWIQLMILAFILVLIMIDSILEGKRFSEQYNSLATRKFSVIRNSSPFEVPINELMVGDVVRLTEQGEYIIWFKGVLAGQSDLMVRQGLKQTLKIPLKTLKGLLQLNKTLNNSLEHVIIPHSKVQKANQNIYFIVTDPNIINKYFEQWFDKPNKRQFPPLVQRYWDSAIQLSLCAILFIGIGYVSLSKINQRSFLPLSHHLHDSFISVLSLPILLFLLHRLLLLYITIKLGLQDIIFHSPSLLSASTSSNLFINFSRLLHVQFESILYKNKLLGFQTQAFQPSAETLKNGNTYESLLAVVLYLSLGHFQQENSLLAQAYQKFKQFFDYEQQLDYQDIVHPTSGKRWQLLKTYPENQDGIRSWMVQYDSKNYYLISEVEGKPEAVFKKLGEKEDNKKKEAYITAAKELQIEGKLIQAMFYRNLREERLRESDKSNGDYVNRSRELLQKDYQFGNFLIFDHALLAQTVSDIQDLKNAQKSNLHIIFIASNGKEELAGFQHILNNIPFIYDCSEHQIGVSTRSKMEESGCIFLGGGVQDHIAFSIADFTFSIKCQDEQLCLPADITIKSIAQVQQVIQKSKLMLDISLQALRLAIISGFLALVGAVYLQRKYVNFIIDSKLREDVIVMAFFVAVPILIRIIIEGMDRQPNEEVKKEADRLQGIIATNFFLAILGSILITVGVIFLFQIEGLCQAGPKIAALTLRTSASAQVHCKNIVIFLSITACTLTFICFYGGKNWLKEPLNYARLLMLIPWAGFLYFDNYPLIVILAVAGVIVAIVFLRIIVKHCAK